jgi:chromosome segregation ATPase
MRREVFIIFLFCSVSFFAGPSLAANRSFVRPSVDDLTESLQVFRESVSKLEDSNAELSEYNGNLKEHIQQAKAGLLSLNKEREQLEKDAKLYASKTEKKSGELDSFDGQMNQIKDRMQSVEQDVSLKQRAIEDRLRRQQVIWEQLAVAKDNQSIDKLNERNTTASAEIVTEKVELTHRLEDARKQLEDLKEQISYESVLREDPAASLPKLTAQRDNLRQKLASLSPGPVSNQKSPVDPNELKRLNFEVNELARHYSDQTNLLQMLESQYDKNQKLTKNAAEEKKLQESINPLKKNNKLLRQQAADLKFEMVDLDKRKAQLEQAVNSAK